MEALSLLHHSSHATHAAHTSHATGGHGGCVLLDLGDDCLSSRQEGSHAAGVIQGTLDNLKYGEKC
jgi:hypothetical protein